METLSQLLVGREFQHQLVAENALQQHHLVRVIGDALDMRVAIAGARSLSGAAAKGAAASSRARRRARITGTPCDAAVDPIISESRR